jgi:hypothetical protein
MFQKNVLSPSAGKSRKLSCAYCPVLLTHKMATTPSSEISVNYLTHKMATTPSSEISVNYQNTCCYVQENSIRQKYKHFMPTSTCFSKINVCVKSSVGSFGKCNCNQFYY